MSIGDRISEILGIVTVTAAATFLVTAYTFSESREPAIYARGVKDCMNGRVAVKITAPDTTFTVTQSDTIITRP